VRGVADGGATPALQAVDLIVRPGEVVALLGPNGAGKSTLLRVAAGLLTPELGTVRVFGRDIPTMERRAVARVVGFVAQADTPAAGFRVREVVAMGRAPWQDAWMRATPADQTAVQRALGRCDLSDLADRLVDTLSGGERRRVSIARALAQEPRLLLLDEPAAFFDVRHRLGLERLLGELAARDGIASLVAMHDLDDAARVASAVVLLSAGRVVACGPPGEVMTEALLRQTFDADVEVGRHGATGRPYFVARGA
jgi:iron complex transport system ATP-binding protein